MHVDWIGAPWISFRKNPLFGAFPRDLARLRGRRTPPALRALAGPALAATRGDPRTPPPARGPPRGPARAAAAGGRT